MRQRNCWQDFDMLFKSELIVWSIDGLAGGLQNGVAHASGHECEIEAGEGQLDQCFKFTKMCCEGDNWRFR